MTPSSLESYRSLFPVCERYVYLNNAGVAPTSTRVREAITRWLDALVEHGIAGEAGWERAVDETRAAVAQLLGCAPNEIAFVRNTSHGLGLVAEGLDWQPGDEVIVCEDAEYPSNVYPWRHLQGRGVVVRPIPAQAGGVEVGAVHEAISERTRLVSASAVQYASGHRTDLERLGALCAEHDVLLCVDGIQQVGVAPLDVKRCGIHFLSADSHKWMLGVPGIGVLFMDERVAPRVRPVLVGWKSTTDAWNFDRPLFELRDDAPKLEEGSPAYALLAGLGATVALLQEAGIERIASHVSGLLDGFEAALTPLGWRVSPPAGARVGILMLEPPDGVDVQAAAAALEAASIVASVRRGRIRLSPHLYNTEADVDAVEKVLRGLSPS